MSVYQRNMERGFVITARRRTREVIDIPSVVPNQQHTATTATATKRAHGGIHGDNFSKKSGYNFKKKARNSTH